MEREFGLPKVAVPGPETMLHVVVKVENVGNPSSVAIPLKVAVAGRVMV